MFSIPSRCVVSRRDCLRLGGGSLCAVLLPAWGQPNTAQAVVLSISTAGSGQRIDFEMAALERLPQVSFTTATPWYSQPTKFTGPSLRDVLAAAGARGSQLVAEALNDYKVTMPLEDTVRRGAIVAIRVNDKPIAVRDKGPLFVVFPFDTASELQTERYYNRSIWQLRSLRAE